MNVTDTPDAKSAAGSRDSVLTIRWIGQWWEDGHRRNLVLGRASEISKSAALSPLAEIVRPINNRQRESNPQKDFVCSGIRLLWKWKSRPAGRPRVPVEIRKLIGEMAANNPTCGEERIANELLLKIGIQ